MVLLVVGVGRMVQPLLCAAQWCSQHHPLLPLQHLSTSLQVGYYVYPSGNSGQIPPATAVTNLSPPLLRPAPAPLAGLTVYKSQ